MTPRLVHRQPASVGTPQLASMAGRPADDEVVTDVKRCEVMLPTVSVPEGDELSPSEAATALAVFARYELSLAKVRELCLAPPRTRRLMDSAHLRIGLADLGYIVSGAALFDLVTLADPSAIGVLELQTWLDIVCLRKRIQAEEERERDIREAHVALGGSNKADKVAIKPLLDVMHSFAIRGDLVAAREAIAAKRLLAVESVLALGGEFDEDELDQIKSDTDLVDFDDLCTFTGVLAETRDSFTPP